MANNNSMYGHALASQQGLLYGYQQQMASKGMNSPQADPLTGAIIPDQSSMANIGMTSNPHMMAAGNMYQPAQLGLISKLYLTRSSNAWPV